MAYNNNNLKLRIHAATQGMRACNNNNMWGELVPSKILTNHSQFSRLGIQCPTLVYLMFVGNGLMRWEFSCFG